MNAESVNSIIDSRNINGLLVGQNIIIDPNIDNLIVQEETITLFFTDGVIVELFPTNPTDRNMTNSTPEAKMRFVERLKLQKLPDWFYKNFYYMTAEHVDFRGDRGNSFIIVDNKIAYGSSSQSGKTIVVRNDPPEGLQSYEQFRTIVDRCIDSIESRTFIPTSACSMGSIISQLRTYTSAEKPMERDLIRAIYSYFVKHPNNSLSSPYVFEKDHLNLLTRAKEIVDRLVDNTMRKK